MTDVVTAGFVIGGILLGLLLGFFFGRILTARSLELHFVEREDAARKDARRRSRAAFGGQALEELAPHFPIFLSIRRTFASSGTRLTTWSSTDLRKAPCGRSSSSR